MPKSKIGFSQHFLLIEKMCGMFSPPLIWALQIHCLQQDYPVLDPFLCLLPRLLGVLLNLP